MNPGSLHRVAATSAPEPSATDLADWSLKYSKRGVDIFFFLLRVWPIE